VWNRKEENAVRWATKFKYIRKQCTSEKMFGFIQVDEEWKKQFVSRTKAKFNDKVAGSYSQKSQP